MDALKIEDLHEFVNYFIFMQNIDFIDESMSHEPMDTDTDYRDGGLVCEHKHASWLA